MSAVLVDTSAWIEFYHPHGEEAVKRAVAAALRSEEVAVVAAIAVELLTGARTESDYKKLERDLQALWWLPMGEAEGEASARIAWLLARAGRPVPTVDLLIAGAARVHECRIWHFGDGHFQTITAHGGPPHRDLEAESPS